MALRDLTQLHENPAVVAWWMRTLGRPLVWLTPPARRRGMLAAAAVLVAIFTTLKLMGKYQGLGLPSHGAGAASVVLAQFLLLWLVYRAAAGFSHLPSVLRRHPQWALHSVY